MTKTKKIIISVLVLILLGIGALWFFASPAIGPNGEVTTGKFNIKNFLPFGNGDDLVTDPNNTNNPGGTDQNSSDNENGFNTPTGPVPELRKISDTPVAGGVLFTKNGTTTARFVEKATGNVYETSSESLFVERLTKDTIPKIMRAFWLPDASGFLAQTIDENETILTSFVHLQLSSSSTTSGVPYEAIISNLPTDISEIAVSPDGKKIFYITNTSGAKGYIANPDGTSPTLVFSNFLSEWIPSWINANTILLGSKASNGTMSSGFFLNINSKTLTPAYSRAVGASSLAQTDAQYLLLGNGGVPTLSLRDIKTSTSTFLGVNTLPEKCAWNTVDPRFIFCGVPKSVSSNSFPDSWYQGTLQTNDLIEKINVFDVYTYIMADPNQITQDKEAIDVQNIQVSNKGDYLLFTNKIDQNLWILDLTRE